MISCGFFILLLATASASLSCDKNYDDVKILHVIFRHGDRTPMKNGYPKNPYKNVTFPEGFEELTLMGKTRAFELGRSLGCRYEEILDKGSYHQLLKATSSELNRTRESLLAVLAGMFPPGKNEKISPFLDWQPIAPDYMRFAEDKMLGVHKSCPKLFQVKNTLGTMDPKSRRIVKQIEIKSGVKINNYFTITMLHDYLLVMNELGYAVPLWAKPYFPEPLRTFSNLGWHEVFDENLSTVVGNLLKKIAEDSFQPLAPTDRRVYLYSGHDTNVGAMLEALGAFKNQTIQYSAYVAFEVIEVDGKRAVLVYHDNHDNETPIYLEIPNCGWMCPVEKFLEFANKFYLGDQWCD